MTDKNYLAFLNEDGEIEILDKRTGLTIVQSKELIDDIGPTVEVFNGDKLVHIPKGMSLDDFQDIRKKRGSGFQFSQLLADIICQKIAEGSSLTGICKERGFPSYSAVCRWRNDKQAFREQIEQAYTDRADYYHDQALHAATEASDKMEVSVQRLKHDAYKWAAQVGKPHAYGNQTKVVGDKNAPLNFIVNSGILREGDTGYPSEKDVTLTAQPQEQLDVRTFDKPHDKIKTETSAETKTETPEKVDGHKG